jgi:hypothetical protein
MSILIHRALDMVVAYAFVGLALTAAGATAALGA